VHRSILPNRPLRAYGVRTAFAKLHGIDGPASQGKESASPALTRSGSTIALHMADLVEFMLGSGDPTTLPSKDLPMVQAVPSA
jgi:hypothetical protein